MTTNIQKLQLLEIFTDEELDAIYDAMADFQDHGENEEKIAMSVQSKLTAIFAEK
jgi:hypothetical protein